MLGSLATTSMLCWLTNAHLVRRLHGSLYLNFYLIRINHRVQIIIGIAEFTPKELFLVI